VVIPLYNEARVVSELCRRVREAVTTITDDYEIVLVDDGSTDTTWSEVHAAHARDPHVRGVTLSRNFGHQVALSAALDRTRGDAVVMMDGDLEDPPELIPRLVAKWQEGWDVVYAVKRSRRDSWPMRVAFQAFHALFRRVADIQVPLDAGNLSLLSARVVEVLRAMPERARYLSGLRAWVGYRQTGIEFDRQPRYDRHRRMTFFRLVRLALDAIFGFSHLPLRVALLIGLPLSLAAMGIGVWVLYQRLFTTNAITGWASTIASINFIGGAILLTLGVIGEYVARIYDEVKNRPLYVVREEIGRNGP
jgi:dolichol-phosphate mannosyltransferase